MSEHGQTLIRPNQAVIEPGPSLPSKDAPLASMLHLPTIGLGIAYLVAYVVSDWISFVEPYGPFAITPWNPNTGLSIVMILTFGRRMIPFQFSPPLSDFVILQPPCR
jgi:hypothetical protein